MKTREITSKENSVTIEISSDTELIFQNDFIGFVDIKVNIEKPTLVILSKERVKFFPYDYWCFYNRRNVGKTCFCVSTEDLEEGDILHLEFDDNNNCLMSVKNEILSHIMDETCHDVQ